MGHRTDLTFGNPVRLLLKLLQCRYQTIRKGRDNPGLQMILFSKDRPIQLDGLLRSMRRHLSGDYRLQILWTCSSAAMCAAYKEVFRRNEIATGGCTREQDFRTDLLRIAGSSQASHLMFLVDDLLFIGSFNLGSLDRLKLRSVVPSLRLGPGISHSQPTGQDTIPPVLTPYSRPPWLRFSWTKAAGDWSLPTSLDGNVFDRKEMFILLQALKFKAPNSLEKAIGAYRFWFKHRDGLCLQLPVLRNFAFNRVQSENSDFPCGHNDAANLLHAWVKGSQMDLAALEGIQANSCHVSSNVALEPRASIN